MENILKSVVGMIFYQLSNRELYFYLQRALQPRGSKELADLFIKYVDFEFD